MFSLVLGINYTQHCLLAEKFLDSKFVLSGLIMFDGVEVRGSGQTAHYCLSPRVQTSQSPGSR